MKAKVETETRTKKSRLLKAVAVLGTATAATLVVRKLKG